MKRAANLDVWPLTRSTAAAWRVSLAGSADDAVVVHAVARGLALSTSAAEAARELITDGDYLLAEMLIHDPGFSKAIANPTRIADLETELERARSAAIAEIRSKLTELEERARRVDVELDAGAFVKGCGASQLDDLQRLAKVEADVQAAEFSFVSRIQTQLAKIVGEGADDSITHWAAHIEHALRLGALTAAQAALERGPTKDTGPVVDVPPPPVWPYRDEPLDRAVGWFFDEGVLPPGFDRFKLQADDKSAWDFLEALRHPASTEAVEVLRSLAALLGCNMGEVVPVATGVVGHLLDLSAPGLHVFGRARWEQGVPFWFDNYGRSNTPDLVKGCLYVCVTTTLHPRCGEEVLALNLHDVLAVLHDPQRRERLLAHLGRQVPLSQAFGSSSPDPSTSWRRNDLPDLTEHGATAVLIAGSPGMGKSTLLASLAERGGGVVIKAAQSKELPQEPVVAIDEVDSLNEEGLRGLVREIVWAKNMRNPAPMVVLAVRPETRARVISAAPSLFSFFELPRRSLSAIAKQASTMLGWVGVEAEAPGSYDRMALLSGGNPAVLILLCKALAAVIETSTTRSRRFSPAQIEEAWRSPDLRDALRELLWSPIADREGVRSTVEVLATFLEPGARLSMEDLLWAVGETLGRRSDEWLEERVTLLEAYGLVRRSERGVTFETSGPGMLVAGWAGV